jgi:hypothetical protein
MITDENRFYVFFIGCIGFRLLMSIVAKNTDSSYLPYLGGLSLLPAIGFLYIFITKSRQTGFEAGGKIWWNYMRPVHSFLYAMFALYAFKQNNNAWLILLLDVALGFISKIAHILFV